MPVSLTCPSGHRLTVSRRYAGKLVRCPKCGKKTRIPSLETIEQKLKEQQVTGNSAEGSSPREAKGAVTPASEQSITARSTVRPPKKRKSSSPSAAAPPSPEPLAVESPAPPVPPLAADAPAFDTIAELPPPSFLEAPPIIVSPAMVSEAEAPPIESPSPKLPQAPPREVPSPRVRSMESPAAPATASEEMPESAASGADSTTSPAAETPQVAPPADAPVRGYRPEAERRWTCLGLGVALAVIGVFGAVPAVLEIADFARSDGTVPVARWAWLALFAAAVQIAYAVYAAQLPDWSTAWVVTLAGAALATVYAFLLALTLVAGESSSIVAGLQLNDQVPQGRATRWCFAMLGILGVYAYFAGRSALGWRHAFRLTRPVKESRAP